MSIICIIPARGGSKRIPRKNVRDFCGKPMIAWSIEAALQTKLFKEVRVSTDDPEIAEVATTFGAKVPCLRKACLSNDTVTYTEVMISEASRAACEFVCFLTATAPLLYPETIREGWRKMDENARDLVFSVLAFPHPVQRGFELDSSGSPRMLWPERFSTRSQDLPQVYHDAGQFYWGRTETFAKLAGPLFEVRHTGTVALDRTEAVDIDTEEDWKLAEQLFKIRDYLK